MSIPGHYHGGRFCTRPCETFDSPRASDLPDGTVVAEENIAYIKNHPSKWNEWRGTNGSHVTNRRIEVLFTVGARVLRYGYGEPAVDPHTHGGASLREHDERIRRDLAQKMSDDRRLFHDIETRVLGDALGAADDIQDIVVAWLRDAGEAGDE